MTCKWKLFRLIISLVMLDQSINQSRNLGNNPRNQEAFDTSNILQRTFLDPWKLFRLSGTAGGSGRQASWPSPSDLCGSRKYPPLRRRTPRRKKLNLKDGHSIINIGQWKHKAFKASSSKPFGDLLLSLASCHSSNINLFFE